MIALHYCRQVTQDGVETVVKSTSNRTHKGVYKKKQIYLDSFVH